MPYEPADDYTEPLLIELGRNVKRARLYAEMSQMRLEELSGVDQTMISRLERACAAAMSVSRLIRIGAALEPNFPLGTCPHHHSCPWQPLHPDSPPRMNLYMWDEGPLRLRRTAMQ